MPEWYDNDLELDAALENLGAPMAATPLVDAESILAKAAALTPTATVTASGLAGWKLFLSLGVAALLGYVGGVSSLSNHDSSQSPVVEKQSPVPTESPDETGADIPTLETPVGGEPPSLDAAPMLSDEGKTRRLDHPKRTNPENVLKSPKRHNGNTRPPEKRRRGLQRPVAQQVTVPSRSTSDKRLPNMTQNQFISWAQACLLYQKCLCRMPSTHRDQRRQCVWIQMGLLP